MELTEQQKTLVDDLICTACYDGIGYWAHITEATATTLAGYDHEDADTTFSLDAEAIIAWLSSDAALKTASAYNSYQAKAILDLAATARGLDVDDVDYDADTADIIVQMIAFGEMVYG